MAAMSLRGFRIVRTIVWSALEYAEAHQGDIAEVPGVVTKRLIRSLRGLLQSIDIQISWLEELAQMGDLSWRAQRLETLGLGKQLRADLEALRQWLVDQKPRLEAAEAHQALVLADHGVRIIGRALVGEAEREEVIHHTQAARDAVADREAEGAAPDYLAVIGHWLEVWERLVAALAERPRLSLRGSS